MSNLFQTIASGLGELKIWYQGPIVSQFNDDTPIYSGAVLGKEKWSGLQVNRPLKVRRNQGIGATSDGGVLPAIGRQTTLQAVIPAKFNYLRFGVTGPMIKSSANDVGSFVRSAAYELDEGYKDLQSDMNRQLSWDGTGWLASMSVAAVATQSITISGRTSVEAALKFIDVGLTFDVVTSAGVIVQQGLEVSSISSGSPTSSTAVLVLSAPLTASAGDKLIRANSLQQEVQGILTQMDGGTSTLFTNVNRALYPSTQSNYIHLSGGQLTLDKLQQAWNAGLNRGGAKYSAIYSDFDSLRMYQKLLTADKRYVNSMKGDGGFSSKDKTYLEFNGTPWVADKDCPQKVFMLSEGALKKYVLAEMDFADETGSMMIAQVSSDSFEVRLRFFMNLFNEKASACSILDDYVSP